MPGRNSSFAILCIFFSFLLTNSVLSQEWPQWRGTDRNGYSSDIVLPSPLPDSLRRTWRIEAGSGIYAPVSDKSYVYLLTRSDAQEIVTAYQLNSGAKVWQQQYAAPFIANTQAASPRLFPISRGKGPFATPLLHKGKLYTLGVDRIFTCFEAKSGEMVWQQHFFPQQMPASRQYQCPPCGCSIDGKLFDAPGICTECNMAFTQIGLETTTKSTGNYYGAVASPLVFKDHIIVHIGNDSLSAVVACNRNTGETIWQWEGASMASVSPMAAEIWGVWQLVLLTRSNIAGIDLANGQELWTFPLNPNAQVITPMIRENHILFAEYRGPLRELKVFRYQNQWEVETSWENPEKTLWTSTPIIYQDLLFGFFFSQRGHFALLNSNNGTVRWESEGRMGFNASLIATKKRLLAMKDNGELIILDQNATAFQPLRTYSLSDQPVWAHPVLGENFILVKDETYLSRWDF